MTPTTISWLASATLALTLGAAPAALAAGGAAPEPCPAQRAAVTAVERSIEAHNNTPNVFTPEQRSAYAAYNHEARRLNSARTTTARALRECLARATSSPPAATPSAPLPVGELGTRGEQVFLRRSGATDLNAAWTRPGERSRTNFPGLDATSSRELSQVKVYGPGNERTYLGFLRALRSDASSTSLSRKAVTAIAEAAARTRDRGARLPLPRGYSTDPLGYVRERTVFRIPDDQVAGTRAAFVADAMAHPGNYGLPRTLTSPQAQAYADRRFQGLGATYDQLSGR